jgi:hypothetical protein
MSEPAALRLYVYYRVSPQDAPAALAAFTQARGEAPVELLQRPELSGGLHTWMEVYPASATVQEPVIAAAMAPWVADGRHVERFTPLA